MFFCRTLIYDNSMRNIYSLDSFNTAKQPNEVSNFVLHSTLFLELNFYHLIYDHLNKSNLL